MISVEEVRCHSDPEALAFEAAGLFLTQLAAAQQAGHSRPQVGLTGGSISDAMHRAIPVHPLCQSVDWTDVDFWWGDERFVPRDSDERNAGQARRAFLDVLDVPSAHIHEIGSSDEYDSAEAAAAAYSEEIRSHGAGAFTILMLGMGPDGHIASLFPHHPAADTVDAIACAVHDSPKPPATRVTLTKECLNRSREVWFLVAGEEKSGAVNAARQPETDPRDIPARSVRGSQRTLWLLDRAAGGAACTPEEAIAIP